VDRLIVLPGVAVVLGIVMRAFGSGTVRSAGYFVFDLGLVMLTFILAAKVKALSSEPWRHNRVRRLGQIALAGIGSASIIVIARHLGVLPVSTNAYMATIGLLGLTGVLALVWPWLRPAR
jgi:hypothetical protein